MKRITKTTSHTLFGLLVSAVLYFGFLSFSNPNKVPITALVIPSVLLGFVIFFLVRLIQQTPLMNQKIVTALVIAVYAVVLSLLASLQQLGWRDAILSAVLVWLFVFYFNRYRR